MIVGALVRKELRQLLPLIVGIAALQLLGTAEGLLSKSPDTFNWATTSWVTSADAGKWVALTELLLGVLVAYSLLPGEHDQRTIELLYTLPVRRRTVFLVKYATGCGVVAFFDVLGSLEPWLRHRLNPGSFERLLPLSSILLLHLRADLALPPIFVAYGMLLSFFRRLGWILFALIWTALEVAERLDPRLRILNVKALMTVEHDGTRPLVNWRAWALHAGMAAVALLLAAVLWLTRQERFAAVYQRFRAGAKLRRATIGLAMVATAVFLGTMAGTRLDSAGPEAAPPPERVLQLDTKRFHFTYRASRSTQAMIVARAADQAYARVAKWLGAPDIERIVADLTDESDEHAGLGGWKKLRLDVRPPRSDGLLVHTLYHETTHVFAAALSDGAPASRRGAMRFFDEGLAEYVSYQLVAERGWARDEGRRIGALAKRRYHLRFEDLLDPQVFLRRQDEYLLYALGEAWVAALVEACGQGAPAGLLRTFGRADTPQTLGGVELWRHGLQMQRCDLERVNGGFERILLHAERDAGDIPIATARFAGAVEGERGTAGGGLAFEVAVESRSGDASFETVVRVRADADTPAADVRARAVRIAVGTPQRVVVPAPERLGQRLEFQVGARSRHDGYPFFTRWQSTAREGETNLPSLQKTVIGR